MICSGSTVTLIEYVALEVRPFASVTVTVAEKEVSVVTRPEIRPVVRLIDKPDKLLSDQV